MRITEHTKAIVAGIAAAAYVIEEGVVDGIFTAEDAGKAVAALIAVFSVWVFPNRAKERSS